MNMELTIPQIINYILLLVVIFLANKLIKKYIESYSKRVDNELTALQLSIGININEVNSALDGIINDAINEYAIINAIDSITYINEDIEAKIRLFVSNEVAIRLSDTMINKLKL